MVSLNKNAVKIRLNCFSCKTKGRLSCFQKSALYTFAISPPVKWKHFLLHPPDSGPFIK